MACAERWAIFLSEIEEDVADGSVGRLDYPEGNGVVWRVQWAYGLLEVLAGLLECWDAGREDVAGA